MIAGMVLLTAITLAPVQVVPMPEEPELAFRLHVPEGWAFSQEVTRIWHWRYVYASFHSGDDIGLRLDVERTYEPAAGDRPAASGMRFGRDTWEAQVPPGVVYVDIGVDVGGPAPIGPYVWSEERGPERRIAAALEDPESGWETEGAKGWEIPFSRWGESWSILIVARKPFDPDDLDRALAAIRTLRFPPTPVTSPRHAIEAASACVPPHMRPEDTWMEECGLFLHYDTGAEPVGSSYRVEFRILDGTRERTVVRAIAFRVDRDGVVTAVE